MGEAQVGSRRRANAPHAEIFAAIGAKNVNEGEALGFTVIASDPNDVPANGLTLSATGLPTGATFAPATGVFSWTPTEDQQGSYGVTFKVTDNGTPALSDSEIVTITVNDVSEVLVPRERPAGRE